MADETEKPKETPSEDKLAESLSTALSKSLPAAMKPLVEQISASGQIRREEPKPVVDAPIDDVSDEDIESAVRDGRPIAPLLRRRQAAERARIERELVAPLRAQGAAAIGSVARLAADKLEHYVRFKKEIDSLVEDYTKQSGMVATPEMYERAHEIVTGRHFKELVAEDREAQIRRAQEDANKGLEPTGGRNEPAPKEAANLRELLGGNDFELLNRKQRASRKNDDEILRDMGYRGGFKDFVTERKELEALDEELPSLGLDRDWDPQKKEWIN